MKDDEWRQETRGGQRGARYVRQNEDYYARKKRGQLGRYATIDRTWDDDHENKRQLYLIKRERAKAWFFLILSDICHAVVVIDSM